MDQIMQQAAELEKLAQEPTTKLSFMHTSFGRACGVCGTQLEEGERVCSEECASIHAYDIAEAMATGN